LEKFFSDNDIEMDASDTILRRDLSSNGKSRAFINDIPVTLAQLKELASKLIDIHSQHQNLALGTQSFQTDLVDAIANNSICRDEYLNVYTEYSSLKKELAELESQAATNSADLDYIRFQYDTLQQAKLVDGEQEELEEELEILEHAEDIKEQLYRASSLFDNDETGIIGDLKQALQALRQASKNYSGAEELAERTESALIEIKDIFSETDSAAESINFNPERLEQVNDRLDTIYTLEKKYKADSVADLIAIMEKYGKQLERVDSFDELIAELTKKISKAEKELKKAASELTASRKKAAVTIEQQISSMLVPLGIPNIQFKVDIQPKADYDETGFDDIRFMFSANKAVPVQELSAVASGGELSRVMLSVKSLLAGAKTLPTIIFDEIDTGVSGAIADKMAQMMQQMCADGHQVLAITHLPQIAACGDYHYKVYKEDDDDSTQTGIIKLNKEERITEIAQMMSGTTLSKAAIENAKSLIENNGR
jgi:DNA repair protein RecN (Recombination protein N)